PLQVARRDVLPERLPDLVDAIDGAVDVRPVPVDVLFHLGDARLERGTPTLDLLVVVLADGEELVGDVHVGIEAVLLARQLLRALAVRVGLTLLRLDLVAHVLRARGCAPTHPLRRHLDLGGFGPYVAGRGSRSRHVRERVLQPGPSVVSHGRLQSSPSVTATVRRSRGAVPGKIPGPSPMFGARHSGNRAPAPSRTSVGCACRQRTEMGYLLGIDVGTTFTAAAVNRDGRVEMV